MHKHAASNTLNQKEEIWSEAVEEAFREALTKIPKLGRRKVLIGKKSCGRNELVGFYITKLTNKKRTRKQISSHIQVLKQTQQDNHELMRLLAEPSKEEERNIAELDIATIQAMFYGATSAGGRCTRELSSSSSSPSPTPMSSPSTAGSDSMEPLSPRQESPMLVAEDDSAPLSFSAGVFSSQHTSTSRRRASGYRRISVSSLLNPISDFHIDQSPPPLSPSSSLPSSSSSLSSSIGPSRHRRHKSLASPASSSSSSSTSYVPGQSCGNHGCSSCHGPETPMSFHHRSQYHHHHQPYPYSHPYPQQKPQQLPQLFPCQVHSRERQSSLWRSFEE